MVAATLASAVTNVQDAMVIVLRVIKNRDMSTHTLFNMMDTSKKVALLLAACVVPAALTAAQGSINRSEFVSGLTKFNIKLPADKENELWQLVDANGDGDISYQEFKVRLRNSFVLVSLTRPSALQACFSSSASERRRLRQGHAAARAAEAERMKQAQAAAHSLRRDSRIDSPVVQLASAPAAGGGLEVDVEFEVEKRTQKLKRELQDVTRKFEREAAEYRLSHSQAIRKISEMSTQHLQEQQQQNNRVQELQDSLVYAQKQHEHFEKEVRIICMHRVRSHSNNVGTRTEAFDERESNKLRPRGAGLEEDNRRSAGNRLRFEMQRAGDEAASGRGKPQI